jgi:hypothetical protein
VKSLKRQNTQARQRGEMTAEEANEALQKLSRGHVEQIKEGFGGRIVRRTPQSKQWDGKRLLELPSVVDHMMLVTPSEKEREALARICEKATR